MARRRQERSSQQRQHNDTGSGLINTKVIIMSSCFVVAVCIGFKGYLETRVNTRFDANRLVEKSGLDLPDRYWGSYRPGVYFGMKTREPHSLVAGLMWYVPRLLKSNGEGIRHWCEQGDNLKHYTWTEHDGRNFGVQEIDDGQYHLETKFVKRLGGRHGGDWTGRISVTNQDPQTHGPHSVSLILYVALDEKTEGYIQTRGTEAELGVFGETSSLGAFKFTVVNQTGAIERESYLSTTAPGLHLLKETVLNSLKVVAEKNKRHIVLPGQVTRTTAEGTSTPPNFIAIQVTGSLPFEIDFIYESGSFQDRPNRISGNVFQAELKKFRDQFSSRFESTFHLAEKGWNGKEVEFAKAALSNMLGGIGYFYGASRVSSAHTEGTVPYWKAPLYTGVPSRSFFPRGFLWDEAFHGLLISTWDLEIELDIMHHWFDLMNIEGWIPREQILGVEALAKVPEEFVTQVNTNANPPVFFLTLEHILHHNELKGQLDKLDRMYVRLEAWYDWFNTTQKGPLPTSYRWRGRDGASNRELNPKTLTSGLDDYPRASHPTEDERHVDLRCWMALAASTMVQLAALLGRDASRFIAAEDALHETERLNELHWSEGAKQFSDYGLTTDGVVLKRPPTANRRHSDGGHQQPLPMVRVVLQEPTLRFVDSHFGYVSLFPFLLQILPSDSPQLKDTLDKLRDEKLLWSPYGLRSLAKTSPLYDKHNTEHDPPYWRGAIWMNVNYLAVRALHRYANDGGPFNATAKVLYTELRQNLINNVIRMYYKSGYVWEQYSDVDGHGKGCKPFTGWSALTVLMMSEIY